MKDDRVYLTHILESIERVEQYTASGKEAFFADPKAQDATLRRLQTMAESTKRLSEEVKSSRPEVKWKSIAGFRNAAVHDYLNMDLNVIWEIAREDLPELKSAARALLREREEEAADDDKTNE